jgi:hypothetical protein
VAPATPGQIPPLPGAPVLVSAGFQTWVPQGQAPVPPVPATRAAVGNQFPTFDELTGGELTDAKVLGGAKVAPVVATMPTSRAATPFDARPGVEVYVQKFAAINTSSCTPDPGTFTVTTKPSHGTLRFVQQTRPGQGSPCLGKMIRYTVVYYTWTDSASGAQSDFFTTRWTAPGIANPADSAWLALLQAP